MTSEIVVSSSFDAMMGQAKVLIESGFLPTSIKGPAQAVAIMTMARELGIGMWAGFAGINIIQGKPTISAQLMLALINKSGLLEDMNIADDGQACTVTMKRVGR